jgi:hypothetical protein
MLTGVLLIWEVYSIERWKLRPGLLVISAAIFQIGTAVAGAHRERAADIPWNPCGTQRNGAIEVDNLAK